MKQQFGFYNYILFFIILENHNAVEKTAVRLTM